MEAQILDKGRRIVIEAQLSEMQAQHVVDLIRRVVRCYERQHEEKRQAERWRMQRQRRSL